MRHTTFAAIGLATLLIAGTSQAQVDYTDVKAGTMLDGKGIRIGAFVKPVPLPPGDWLVVARNDTRRPLSGGNDTFNSTSQITFSLKSTNVGNPIYALLVSFAPDTVPVNWNGNYCDTTNRAFSLTYGSGKYGSGNACASGQWFSAGLRAFLGGAPTHTTPAVREQYAALAPYAAQAPEPYTTIHINARRDRGRTVDYMVYAGIPPNFRPGDDFDTQTREWVKNSAQSVIDMLDNTVTPMPAFPDSAGTTTPLPALDPKHAGPKGVELNTLQVGAEASEAIRLPNYGAGLPLPPGRWLVAGRHDVGGGANTTLTLRNSDPTATLTALVMTLLPAQFNATATMGRCQGAAKGQFQIVEDLGTTAGSVVNVCAVGGLYAASLKQMVRNAPTNNNPWFKQNLTPLTPYEVDMPDAHIWLSLDSGRSGHMRVQWALYSRTPPGLQTGRDTPLREWVRAMGQSMLAFHNNQYRAIGPYPASVATP